MSEVIVITSGKGGVGKLKRRVSMARGLRGSAPRPEALEI